MNFFSKKSWDYWGLFVLCVSTGVFFVFQHTKDLGWDFMAYVLNAKYFFAGGTFLEPYRPPLVSFLLGILSMFGWQMSEYIFIIATSVFFIISFARLARSLHINALLFTALALSTYLLTWGLKEGTELLSLSSIALFLSQLIQKRNGGHWLGCAALARYNLLAFALLLVFYGDTRKIIKNLVIMIAVLLPWFVYNFIKYGNFFFSIADLYANNIFFRKDYIFQPPVFGHFLQVAHHLTPFFVIGVLFVLISLMKKNKTGERPFISNELKGTILAIMALLILFTVGNYLATPIKRTRFLFPLIIPITYFSLLGTAALANLIRRDSLRRIITPLIVFTLLVFNFKVAYSKIEETRIAYDVYEQSISEVQERALQHCSIMSNGYVQLNYFGLPVQNFPRKELVERRIAEGEYIILFPHIGEPEYASDKNFLKQFPAIHREQRFVILGEEGACNSILPNDKPFMYRVDESTFEIKGEHTPTDPCVILAYRKDMLINICRLMNFQRPRTNSPQRNIRMLWRK